MDRAELNTPSDIKRELKLYGGTNGYGKANWRIALAEDRTVLRGSVTSSGLAEVPKYPCKGWILERWFPASKYGLRRDWEAVKCLDGETPLMGPYPSEGEYFMLAGPWQDLPTMQDLRNAISLHIREENSNPINYDTFTKQLVDEEQDEYERNARKAESDLAHFYESEVEPILRGTSLEAQRIRNELQEAMGDRSHLGVM